jgi:hypothetical protein
MLSTLLPYENLLNTYTVEHSCQSTGIRPATRGFLSDDWHKASNAWTLVRRLAKGQRWGDLTPSLNVLSLKLELVSSSCPHSTPVLCDLPSITLLSLWPLQPVLVCDFCVRPERVW